MKKLPCVIFLLMVVCIIACNKDEDYWTKYENWRKANDAYFEAASREKGPDGQLMYEKVSPSWDKGSYVLMKYHTRGTRTDTPFVSSYVDVKYKGMLYNGTPFDSSYNNTAVYGDSIYRSQLSDNILGWIAALTHMAPGDSCTVIIPQNMAYGSAMQSSLILPYSTLKFEMKLIDIPGLEKPAQ
ncbi:FKBP-type peptidyl-prolyl cis-trans isomerase [Coprobacter tertius]|uniref:Peptidyl-prolyl cis-trans isomerase n=1 Tax=Coprobacter tertius TaxID=2944915 RepID=A0ABT1MKP3_9BACT|nr:FKBP-type peptidyl-prolyl cis-trans isomerase [Coprobacter tertius]MCP9612974.1 FKBP-type peptidyl-prolyl cis-trans isomerase [Coprobacter tertius]